MRSAIVTLLRAARRTLRRTGFDIIRTPARELVNAHYRGRRFECFSADRQCQEILTGRGWDNQLPALLNSLASRDGHHIVEIGANIGGSLVPHANDFPDLKFHCVEPVPEFFNILTRNVESFACRNVQLYHHAVTDTEGSEVVIHTQIGTAGALARYDDQHHVGVVRLAGRTLDGLFGELPVALLKIDTDGFELSVLRGATQLLRRNHPDVFIEVHAKIMRALGTEPGELIGLLEAAGYTYATVWDNMGVLQVRNVNLRDVIRLANEARYYVDVLFAAQR